MRRAHQLIAKRHESLRATLLGALGASRRRNSTQLVAMYLSPPFGMLPRWVWVKAVGAMSSEPVLGTILRRWYRNAVSPSLKLSLRYIVHSTTRCSDSPWSSG